jgi:hypothetical protein
MQPESPTQSGGSQLTAVNQSVKARCGTEFAYRRFGNAGSGNPPLLFLQHFRGNLENWDPLLIDTLSHSREVILLDGADVGLSSGTTPRNITDMARDAISFGKRQALVQVQQRSPTSTWRWRTSLWQRSEIASQRRRLSVRNDIPSHRPSEPRCAS